MPAPVSLRAQAGLLARGSSIGERRNRIDVAGIEPRLPSTRAPRRQTPLTRLQTVAAGSESGYPRAFRADVQDRQFDRTPKEWITGDRTQKCDAIKKMRLITAVKTPYLDSGKIDLFAYDKLVVAQIEAGVEGLIVGGTTGEGQLMSWDEHIMLIAHTANRFGQDIGIIGNTGSNATREAVHATCQGFAVGMDAALHINPYYGKTSRDGLIYHFNAVLDYGPTIVYNVPGRTGQDISPDVVHELALHPNFAGMKECMGNERIRGYTQRGIACWSGNDDECHDARYDCGAVGVISVTSNIVPGLMRSLMFDGPNPQLRDKLQPLMQWLFLQPNPIGLNTALAMLGASRPVFRLPYTPYGKDLQQEGKKIMDSLGRANLVLGGEARVLDSTEFKVLEQY